MSPAWAAVGPEAPGRVLACAMRGTSLLSHGTATDEAGALAAADAETGRIVRVGQGPAVALPAPVLPDSGPDLPALAQDSPRDLIGGWMRLRVAGLLAERGDWDGVICAADGDVSHWLHVSAAEIVSSRSFLTWRLVAALGGARDAADPKAVSDSLSRPAQLASDLRSAELRGDAAALTGHLLGAELAAARPYWLGQAVIVIHRPGGGAPQAGALAAQGVQVTARDSDGLLEAGLGALGRDLGLS